MVGFVELGQLGPFGSRSWSEQRTFECALSRGCMSLFPAWTELANIQTVSDAVTWFNVDPAAWRLWLTQVGDPQDDLRLVAALPKSVVAGACGLAAQNGPFSVLHAAQVGLVWRLAKMVMSHRAARQPQEHVDGDPWGSPTGTTTGGAAVKERVLKMASRVDQADESELLPPTPFQVDAWTQADINFMGAPLKKKKNLPELNWRP